MLGLTGEPLLGELLLGELLPTPLNMLARSQLVSRALHSGGGRWLPAPCSALSGWKDRTQRGAVGGAVKSSSWEAPPRTQVSSSSGRDGGTSEKMTRKTSSGWKEQRPRGRTGDLALARRTFGLSQPQPSSSFPAEGQRALQGGKGWEHDLEGVHCSH